MKFEIELNEGEYLIAVDAEMTGQGSDSGADNPDDYYGYVDVEWEPLTGTRYDVYGNITELTKEQLYEVGEAHREEAEKVITEYLMDYAKEYAEDAALDAVDFEFCDRGC